MSAVAPPAADPVPGRSWVLGLMCFAQLLLQLDFAIVNVALAAIRSELGFSAAGLQWVVTGYALTFGSLLLVGGTIGDRFGYRRTIVVGLICFALASLIGGVSVDPVMLVIARFAQGAAAALVAPNALAMITSSYTDPVGRARALGVFQGATAAGASAGVVLGGVLVQIFGWRSVMLVNPPLIVVLLLLIILRIPAVRGSGRGHLDVLGAATVAAAAAALVFGMSQGQQSGFTDAVVIAALVLSAAGFVAFVAIEARISQPMLPLRLLTDRMRGGSLGAMFLVSVAVVGYVYFTALYLQRTLHFSALLTGLSLLPATALIMVTSIVISRRMVARLGLTTTLLIGLALMAIGQASFARAGVDGSYVADILPGLIINALGMGLALPTISIAANAGARPEERGVVGGLLVTSQQLGAAIGLAALAVIAAARAEAAGNDPAGYQLAYLVAGGICLAALAVIALTLPRDRRVAGPTTPTSSGPS